MQFIETPIFTKQIIELLEDAEYRRFQMILTLNPEAGDVIRGGGGLRKIRWSAQGRGKRGGIRVIYYILQEDGIYLLFAYPKNKQEDLSNEQLRVLRALIKEELS
ncbi:hypothetical protein DB345_04075 [Spartobacteria bacterium LR76]|nr:hypothetical protein DB345_04075 [Spartobacteria bacterium LR76]